MTQLDVIYIYAYITDKSTHLWLKMNKLTFSNKLQPTNLQLRLQDAPTSVRRAAKRHQGGCLCDRGIRQLWELNGIATVIMDMISRCCWPSQASFKATLEET